MNAVALNGRTSHRRTSRNIEGSRRPGVHRREELPSGRCAGGVSSAPIAIITSGNATMAASRKRPDASQGPRPCPTRPRRSPRDRHDVPRLGDDHDAHRRVQQQRRERGNGQRSVMRRHACSVIAAAAHAVHSRAGVTIDTTMSANAALPSEALSWLSHAHGYGRHDRAGGDGRDRRRLLPKATAGGSIGLAFALGQPPGQRRVWTGEELEASVPNSRIDGRGPLCHDIGKTGISELVAVGLPGRVRRRLGGSSWIGFVAIGGRLAAKIGLAHDVAGSHPRGLLDGIRHRLQPVSLPAGSHLLGCERRVVLERLAPLATHSHAEWLADRPGGSSSTESQGAFASTCPGACGTKSSPSCARRRFLSNATKGCRRSILFSRDAVAERGGAVGRATMARFGGPTRRG